MKKLLASILAAFTMLLAFSTANAVSHTDYPYQVGVNVWAWDGYGFYQSECTSYVAWRLNSTNGVAFHNSKNPYTGAYLPASISSGGVAGVWGHAKDWVNAAQYCGCVVDTNPAPGAVYWSGSGSYGHVAWVSEVRAGNKVVIEQYNGGYVNINGEWYGNHEFSAEEFEAGSKGEKYIHIKDLSTDHELDVNGYLDNNDSGNTGNFATFDVYVNGQKKADDVNDFCQMVSHGSTYEIKDIRIASGKAFDGYSSHTRSGYVSGGRTGTVNANTDVRLALHTVDAAAFDKNHDPSQIAVYNGHSYYYYSVPATWYGAEIVSEYLGGHLVTITSADENDFVKSLIGDSACWIGLTDKDKEGTWKWVNGDPFSYEKWNGSSYGGTEPNNDSGSLEGQENYAHILANADRWNDNSGCVMYPFVVEIDRAYSVTYNSNGGSPTPDTQMKAVKQAVTLSSISPSRSGYTFLGWGTSSTSTAASYQPSSKYSQDANLTLYALWQSLTYTIIYDANGGTGKPDGETRTVNGGGAITLSSDIPVMEGYDFLGWAISPTATTAQYQPGGNYPGGSATLYAVWRIKQFNVTFDSSGAGTYNSRVINYGDPLGELPEPSKEKEFFKGWFDANANKVSAETIVKSNLVLTAHWSAPTKMSLPSALTTIEAEAFENVDTNIFEIPSTVASIGSKAFANNKGLYTVIVYSRTVSPASDAFINCPNLTIYGYEDTPIYYYAVAKNIPFVPLATTSDWVSYSELPIGATVLDEKWTYTEVAESTSSSMSGWIKTGSDWRMTSSGVSKYVDFPSGFSTSHALYNKYNPSKKKAAVVTETNKVELGDISNIGYVYYHWTLEGQWAQMAADAGKAINIYIWDRNGTDSDGYTYTRFNAFEVNAILNPVYGTNTSGNNLDLSGDGIYSTCYHAAYNLAEYVSHWWYIVGIKQQPYTEYERVYSFSRDGESSTEIQPGDGITNIQHLVKYGF